MKIPCSKIDASPELNSSRQPFTPESCHELAASIEMHGLQNPVVVSELEDGGYRLESGFRRFTAVSVILEWDTVEATVKDKPSRPGLLNLIENLQREDPSFYEQCIGLKRVFPPDTQMTEIARLLGKSRTWVRTRWLLWRMPEEIISLVEDGTLQAMDVALLISRAPEEQLATAERIKEGKARGEAVTHFEREISNRKRIMPKKMMQRMATLCMENGHLEAMHTLRWACGEIDEKQLAEEIGCTAVATWEPFPDSD